MAAAIVDRDLIIEDEADEFDLEPEVGLEPEISVEPELSIEPELSVEPEPETPADPMSDSLFAEELMGLVDDVFANISIGDDDAAPAAEDGGGARPGGAQIVVSPLFKDFSVDEMVAVIAGLNLLTFERGAVILREGDPGNSLYMLTSGTVRAFVKKAGKNVKVGDLEEGAFFGEVSILTGKPRTASVVAVERCELLELDRPTLDQITKTHPHVRDVLKEFAQQRTSAR